MLQSGNRQDAFLHNVTEKENDERKKHGRSMGKVRFRMWLHKLNELRIKGLESKRRSHMSVPRSSSPSPKGRCFCCGSSQTAPKTGCSHCSSVPRSPVNHKAMDIPFPASPRRDSRSVSPSLSPVRPMGLLNSPMAYPVISRSPAQAYSLGSPIATSATPKSATVSVGCSCRTRSRRKGKEEVRSFSDGIKSVEYNRHSIRRESSALEDGRRTSWEPIKTWEKANDVADKDFVQKKAALRKKEMSDSKTNAEQTSTTDGVEATSLREESAILLKNKFAGKCEDSANANPRRALNTHSESDKTPTSANHGTFRLKTSSSWDREYASFTSDDNFLSSFERRRDSFSSNSETSELFEKNHMTYFEGLPKDGADQAGRSRPRSRLSTLAGTDAISQAELRSDAGALNPSPADNCVNKEGWCDDPAVIYPWLSQEDALDREANAKSWTEQKDHSDEMNRAEIEATANISNHASSSDIASTQTGRRRKNWRSSGRSSGSGLSNSSMRSAEVLQERWQQVREEQVQWQSGDESSSASTSSAGSRIKVQGDEATKLNRSSSSSNRSSSSRRKSMRTSTEAARAVASSQSPSSSRSKVAAAARAVAPSPSIVAARGAAAMEVEAMEMEVVPSDSIIVQGGGMTESVAMVKSSSDPYADFRDSMVDMILQRQMYAAPDLEELLQCFLSLNSLEHHDTIVRAFSEVWQKVFVENHANS